MIQAHGGSVAAHLDAKVSNLVLPDAASGAAMRKKADALRKKGAAIEVMDAAIFRAFVSPTHDELVAILKDGKRGAKALLSVAPPVEHGGHGAAPGSPRLAGARLDGLDLSELDLRGLAFEECSFVGAKLDHVRIAEATECDFSKTTGDSPQFGKIDCSRFVNARFDGAEFRSHLEGSDFTGARLIRCRFLEKFWGAGVTKRPASEGPCFSGASLQDCLFEWVRTDHANFRDAELDGTAFNLCHLNGAILRNAKVREALFVAIDLRTADLSNASLVGSNLAEADLTRAKLDGTDLTDVNLRGAKIEASALKGARGVSSDSTRHGAVGPALAELDSIFRKAKKVELSFRVGKGPNQEDHLLQITAYSSSAHLYLPDLHDRVSPRPLGPGPFSKEILQAGRVFGHLPVRFDTLLVKSTKAPKSGKALQDLLIQGIAEAFGQTVPSETGATNAAMYRTKQRAAERERGAAQRERREQAKAQAAKEKEKAKKQIAKKIEKTVGKVSDVASFLKALEVRIEKPKIDKATKMLKASGFKLFNDVTDEYLSGVVKSQTDPDLVYACRVAHDGQYACCTQNLNVCGGLRGSICKHLLVLIIGLVQAGELDPTTIDAWIAKTHSVKPELDKEIMGAIFIKYKGAEAGEVDWRPTETVPEDYYAL
jgi:uncharacterized protein YjbI with pentapeptide repeats